MIEGGSRARLLFEAAPSFGMFGERSREYFDSDFTAEPSIDGAIGLPHAAGANGGSDLVWPKLSSGSKARPLGPIAWSRRIAFAQSRRGCALTAEATG